jgi:hypothetical protein
MFELFELGEVAVFDSMFVERVGGFVESGGSVVLRL